MENRVLSNTRNTDTVTIPRAEYEAMQRQIDWLVEQLTLSKKRQYGSSSEKVSEGVMEQLSLLFNEAEAFAKPEPEETEVAAHTRKKHSGNVKDILPEDAPVEVIKHELPEEERICPECGTVMEPIGKEVRRSLKLIPAQVVLVEDWYYTYACQKCSRENVETPIVKTPKDAVVIPGSFATPEAIAYLMTQKFVMGSPIYRQEQELKQKDVLLTRQTMSNWMMRASDDWLKPIYLEAFYWWRISFYS